MNVYALGPCVKRARGGPPTRNAIPECSHSFWHNFGDELARVVAAVEHRRAVLRELNEELRLAGKVVLESTVRVEVIVREIREDADDARPCASESGGECFAREFNGRVPPAASSAPGHGFNEAVIRLGQIETFIVKKEAECRHTSYGRTKEPQRMRNHRGRGRFSVRPGDADCW